MNVDLNSPKSLYLLAALLLVVLLFQFMVTPFFTAVDGLELEVMQQQQVNHQMEGWVLRLDQLRHQGDESQSKQQAITSLLPWLERETAASGLKKHVKQISSVNLQKGDLYRERATLRMKEMEIEPMLRLVEKLEQTPGLKIVRSDIRRGTEKKPGLSLFIELGRL